MTKKKKKNNKMIRLKFVLSGLLVSVLLFVMFTILPVQADPVIYYFNNAVSTSPSDLGNYWYDEALSNPALELPNFAVDHVTVSGGVVFAGDAVFRGNSFNYGEVTGNAAFYDSAINDGLVSGNAEFFDNSICGGISGGTVVGNATFYEDSQATSLAQIQTNAFFYDNSVDDGGIVGNDATFYGDLSENSGGKGGESNVGGIQTRYYTTATVTTRNFTLVGPWTVVADGVEVDLTGASFDGTTTFSAINGGSFVYPNGTSYYFNNAVNTSPSELGNYWTDIDCTIPAVQLPNFAFDEVSIVPTGFGFEQTIFDGNITFNGSAVNRGTVTGTAVFNDSSQNFFNGGFGSGQGIVQSTATFNDTSINSSTLESTSTFNDSSQNAADSGVVEANATFNDSAINNGQVAFSATFNDSAVNNGNILANATFNDSSQHASGQVVGDATFNGDLSEIPGHGGSISGTRTRRYISPITTTRSFISDGPWTVLADGAVVNVEGATYNGTTNFTTANGGSFVFPTPTVVSATALAKKITITYSQPLNTASAPSGSDFSVVVNGLPVSVSAVSVTGSTVILTLELSFKLSINDLVTIDYTPGVQPIESLQGADALALNDTVITIATIELGAAPTVALAVGSKIYANYEPGGIKAIDTATNTVVATFNIAAGGTMTQLVLAGTKLYVFKTGGNVLRVIDTATDTELSQITVGGSPISGTLVGTNIYVSNSGSNTISVVNTVTDTVSATITVGNNPQNSTLVGTKLYVNNSFNSISVIDTTTNLVTSTISMGGQPRASVAVGNKLYVAVYSVGVKVIDTTTDSVVATISPDPGIFTFSYITAVGTKIYFSQLNNTLVYVADTNSNTITSIISLPSSTVRKLDVVDTKLVVSHGNSVSIINPVTDTISETVAVGTGAKGTAWVGSSLYVLNETSQNISILDTNALVSLLPNLLSFSSSSASGTYGVGQAITITANFARALQNGSTMTVSLNSGASVVLNTVSGGTLSGTYTVASGESTPDLAVTAITSASVSDLESHTRTSYALPSSLGTFSGENPSLSRNIGDTKNISIGSYTTIAVGQNPAQVSPATRVNATDYVYVSNQGSNSVSVIRLSDNTVVATIAVGSEPYGIASTVIAGVRYVYVSNLSSNTVSVINTNTNAVVATVAVGLKPYFIETIDTNIYVTNGQSNTVSVINGLTNTVSATIAVGLGPRGIEARGTDLYVANYGDPNVGGGNSISIINSLTNTVSDVISLPAGSSGPFGIINSGSNIYTANYRSNNVSVINPTTKSVIATIAVGAGPRYISSVNNAVYVSDFDDGTIWTVNAVTNTAQSITTSGHSPSGLGVFGGLLYFARSQDNLVSILNASNSTLYTQTTVGSSSSGGGSLSPNQTITATPSSPENPSVSPDVPATDQETVVQKIDELLVKRLKGRLLLAVEDHGKIWYVDTVSGRRYEVRLDNALNLFRTLSLGITDKNLLQIPVAGLRSRVSALALRLRGKILLQTEQRGEIWYVDTQGYRHQLTVLNLLDVFRKLALGINNENLDKILIGETK